MHDNRIADSLERIADSYELITEAFAEQLNRSSELIRRLMDENEKLLNIIEERQSKKQNNTIKFGETCK